MRGLSVAGFYDTHGVTLFAECPGIQCISSLQEHSTGITVLLVLFLMNLSHLATLQVTSLPAYKGRSKPASQQKTPGSPQERIGSLMEHNVINANHSSQIIKMMHLLKQAQLEAVRHPTTLVQDIRPDFFRG